MRYYGSEPAPRTCDPLKIQTYAHIDNNASDLADVFPDKFYHTCGYEINDRCPYGDKSIGAYLNQRNMSTHQILARFIDEMEDTVCNRKWLLIWEYALVSAKAGLSKSE